MSNILLSIKPKYAELILNGKKTIELRKTQPKEDVEWVYLYATAPVKKIVGRIKILDFMSGKNFSITLKGICITETEFNNYVGDKFYSLWVIDDAYLQRCSMELSEFNLKRPPQSWCYVETKGKKI